MTIRSHFSVLAALTLLSACAAKGSDDGPQAVTTPPASDVSLKLEQAERQLDTGRDVEGARAQIRTVLADAQITSGERDRAVIAESRAAELLGDKEDATSQIETLLSSHGDGKSWVLEDAADKRLRKLLTGTDTMSAALKERDRAPVAKIASKLATYFPEGPAHDVEIRIIRYAGSDATSKRLGTFNLGGAIREKERAECPLCETRSHVHTWESGEGSWTGLPKYASTSRGSLEVIYFDLYDGRVPSRYDARLPMPSAEIVARLERGEGLVAVKDRGDAPPVILLAAPHWGQMETVEAAFAELTELPKEPMKVEVKTGLSPEEIQSEVRASFGRYRTCYESLLSRSPGAAGTASVAFTIQADGSVLDPTLDEATTLKDATFDACMLDGFRTLKFPAPGSVVTVKYPVSFSP